MFLHDFDLAVKKSMLLVNVSPFIWLPPECELDLNMQFMLLQLFSIVLIINYH
jgi:hypothetical protein